METARLLPFPLPFLFPSTDVTTWQEDSATAAKNKALFVLLAWGLGSWNRAEQIINVIPQEFPHFPQVLGMDMEVKKI